MTKRLIRKPGSAVGRKIPGPDTAELLIVAHDRCRRRGIKVFGYHFTCEKPLKLKLKDLDPKIATRICRHGELRVREYDAAGKCLTPERANPPLPKKRPKAKKPPTPSPAGQAAKKVLGITDPPKPKSNHPKPAKSLPGVEPKRRRGRSGGADG